MGTQFTSRLTERDRKKIVEGIFDALLDIAEPPSPPTLPPAKPGRVPKAPEPKPRRKPTAKTLESLSEPQLRRFGEATVGHVLTVAGTRGFFTSFEESEAFEIILRWLKELRNDAAFSGFTGIIKKYDLASSTNPVLDLSRELRKLTEKTREDPFRLAAQNAASAILAETVTRPVPPKPDESRAQLYGRKLATFSLQELVKRYVHSFVFEVVNKTISMSDPESASTIVRKSISESQRATEKIAKKAVAQIAEKGKLCDVKTTHRIVLEGLTEYATV